MGLGHAVAAPPSSQAEPRRAGAQSHSSVVISRQDEAVGSQATACGPWFPRLLSPRDGGGHMSVGDRNGIWEMGGRWVGSNGRFCHHQASCLGLWDFHGPEQRRRGPASLLSPSPLGISWHTGELARDPWSALLPPLRIRSACLPPRIPPRGCVYAREVFDDLCH